MIGVDRAIQDDVLVGGIDAANVKNEIAVRVTDQSDGGVRNIAGDVHHELAAATGG